MPASSSSIICFASAVAGLLRLEFELNLPN
jgi:hypothetical protein